MNERTKDAQESARSYGRLHCGGSSSQYTRLRAAWLHGWHGDPLSPFADQPYAEAHAAGAAIALDDEAWAAAHEWARRVRLTSLVADECMRKFVVGFKAARARESCPYGRSAMSGYRAAMDAHRTLAVVR